MNRLDVAHVRTLAGTDDVEIVTEPIDVVVAGNDTGDPLRPRTIVRIGEQYLVETIEEPDDWYMGQLTSSGIVCHGAYGRLADAIRAL